MKFKQFRVTNYRNVIDSGPIDINDVTAFVGQNEAGKSNLFEALNRINSFESDADYNIDEDWPVDRWGEKATAAGTVVCSAEFLIEDSGEILSLFEHAAPAAQTPAAPEVSLRPPAVTIIASRAYGKKTQFKLEGGAVDKLDAAKVREWLLKNLPKFVYIREYDMDGSQVELDTLAQRKNSQAWNQLTNTEQTVLVVLELAKIDLADFMSKSNSPAGRTVRAFDKIAASSYLSQQFNKLWSQKQVRFQIDVDATTLDIFVEDAGVGMPVRLSNRSTGFRWHVSFAWKFTHASNGRYKDCVLLLEEPRIHLHYTGQRDLLQVFDRLVEGGKNTILYTTHLASMVDHGNPERVRIVEVEDHHTRVVRGVVSKQRGPMAVIEASLGLVGALGGLLGNRWTLIVEGGIDALILNKLSNVLKTAGKEGLSDRVYLWAAEGASKTPMYASFAVGQKWEAAVLLDSDAAGEGAKKKISDQNAGAIAASQGTKFRVHMLKQTAGLAKSEAGIEDLFPDQFIVDCVNSGYHLGMKLTDLPVDGSDMIATRVERILIQRHGLSGLDKQRLMNEMLKVFDCWHKPGDLPEGTAEKAEKLFATINQAFA
jgi:energy-coupling factor transporter ATP-binding protein EcfA2